MSLKYTITHNSSSWDSSSALDSIGLSNGNVTSSITSAGSRTLNCDGKYMPNNLVIGAKTLNCAGKIMSGNIVITASNALVVKAFSACTWDEINAICNAGMAGTYVDNGTWTIGDTNTTASYGSYSGVQLVHVLDDTQRSTYNTAGHIVVQFKNTVYISTWGGSTSYSVSTLFTSLSSVYSSTSLTSEFKNVLKQFSPPTSTRSNGLEYPPGYLHAPNCKEVGGANQAYGAENNVSFTLKYYEGKGDTGRIKTGADTYWWLRSPDSPGATSYSYYVYSDGDIYYSYYGTTGTRNGVSPMGVI